MVDVEKSQDVQQKPNFAQRVDELKARQVAILQRLTALSKATFGLRKEVKKHCQDPCSPHSGPKRAKVDDGPRPQNPTFQYTKPSKGSKETVVDFLGRRFPYHSPEQWQAYAEQGCITVNGVVATPTTVLDTNDKVSYQKVLKEPAVDDSFRLLHVDEHIVVVSKSGNIPVAEGGLYFDHTLVRVVERHLTALSGRPVGLHSVHRLDRETSGLVVFARTEEAASKLAQAFALGAVRKVYHAVLVGHVAQPMNCALPIAELWQLGGPPADHIPHIHRLRMACDPAGKPCRTAFAPLHYAGGATLCRVELFSGRTHQIRVHAAAMGHPVLGDKLYGRSDAEFLALSRGTAAPSFPPFGLVARHQLHASALAFAHPTTGQALAFHSAVAEAFGEGSWVAQNMAAALLGCGAAATTHLNDAELADCAVRTTDHIQGNGLQ